jgi:hypothetical protein
MVTNRVLRYVQVGEILKPFSSQNNSSFGTYVALEDDKLPQIAIVPPEQSHDPSRAEHRLAKINIGDKLPGAFLENLHHVSLKTYPRQVDVADKPLFFRYSKHKVLYLLLCDVLMVRGLSAFVGDRYLDGLDLQLLGTLREFVYLS